MPGVVSIVHAPAAAGVAVAGMRPHAEDPNDVRHPPLHQEDTCALCQVISGIFTPPAEAPQLPLLESQARDVIRAAELAPAWLTDGSPSLPRAPPARA